MKFLLALFFIIVPNSSFAYCGQKALVQITCGKLTLLDFAHHAYQDSMLNAVKLLDVQKQNGASCSTPGSTSVRAILQVPDPTDSDMIFHNGGYGESSLDLIGDTVTFSGAITRRDHIWDADLDEKNGPAQGRVEIVTKLGEDDNASLTATIGGKPLFFATVKCVSLDH